jgi:methyl-accepting chemotaxis protein
MYEKDLVNTSNWTGVVEDYDDPLKTGRLRVRIYGFHNPNKTILPTECLPWAIVALPVNGSTTFTGPKIGDWVIGFFFDGESAQLPVVTHVLPGINTVLVKQPVGAPRMPAGQIYDRPGQPSFPPLSRGVVQYTAIDTSNRKRAHICDISYEVNQTVTALKIVFGPLFDALRAAINLAIGATCFDPTGLTKQIIDLARQVAQFIKEVTSEINEIRKTLESWTAIAQQVAAMITFIRNLPEQAAIFFRDCLAKLSAVLKKGLQGLFSDLVGDIDGGGFGEVISALKEVSDATSDLVDAGTKLVATPAKLIGIALTPTSQAEADASVAGIKQLISDAGPINSPLDVGQGP